MSFPVEPLPEPPLTLEQAIARVEGWYLKGDVPTRGQWNNNPGNINFGTFSEQFGAQLEDHANARFAKFPTAEQGWQCLAALLRTPAYEGLTLEGAINRYAPPSENDTTNYVGLVANWCGVTVDTPIAQMLAV